MGKPKEEIKEKSYYKDIHFLYEALSTLKNIDEVKLFMKDMLTKAELRMMKRRWHIAHLITQGFDMREVARKSNASTQTVWKMKKILEEGYGGLSIALERSNEKQKREVSKKGDSTKLLRSSKYVKNWFK